MLDKSIGKVKKWTDEFKTFAIKGKDVVEKNIIAMKIALSSVEEVDVSSLEGKEYIETSKEINDKFYNDIMARIK